MDKRVDVLAAYQAPSYTGVGLPIEVPFIVVGFSRSRMGGEGGQG